MSERWESLPAGRQESLPRNTRDSVSLCRSAPRATRTSLRPHLSVQFPPKYKNSNLRYCFYIRADSGNRTRISTLGRSCSTTEPYPLCWRLFAKLQLILTLTAKKIKSLPRMAYISNEYYLRIFILECRM